MPTPSPYAAIAREMANNDERQRRAEEARRRALEIAGDPASVAEAQRRGRETGQIVTPAELPQARMADNARRVGELASRYSRFAASIINPAIGPALLPDVEPASRVARTVAGAPGTHQGRRYQFAGMNAAQIDAELDQREAAAAEGRGTLWRIMHTDLVNAVTGMHGAALDQRYVENANAPDDGFFDAAGKAFMRGSLGALAGIEEFFGGIGNSLRADAERGPRDDLVLDPIFDRVGDAIINRTVTRQSQDRLIFSAQRDRAAAVNPDQSAPTGNDFLSDPLSARGAEGLGRTAVESLPYLMASMLGGVGAAANATSITGSIAGDRAENTGRVRTDLTAQDVGAAAPFGVASAILDRIGARGVLSGAGAVERGLTASVRRAYSAARGEAATEGAQSYIEYAGGVVGTDQAWDWQEANRQALLGSIVGFGMGGTVSAGVDATSTSYRAARRYAGAITRLGDSEEMSATVDTIMAAAAEHGSRTSDPEAFRAYMEDQVSGTPVENVYVSAEAIDTYLRSDGAIDPNGIFSTRQQEIAEAKSLGGEVVIPLSEFSTALAGTPAWEALKQDTRPSPSVYTTREQTEMRDSVMKELEARGDEIVAASAEGETFEQAPMLNVGRNIDATNELLSREQVIAAIEAVGGSVVSDTDVTSDSEITSVVTLAEQLSDEQTFQLSEALQQKAVARFDDRGGAIIGPRAAEWIKNWGDFNPEFFFLGDGSRLSSRTLQQDPAVKVFDQFKAQLLAAGFNDADATQQAGVVAAHRERMAEMLGVSPEQYHADNPIEVNREGPKPKRKGKQKPNVLDQLGEAIEVDGVSRPTANSDGQQIAGTEEEVRNFWRWFGNSKVVDADGRPLVVYHGTPNPAFDVFDFGQSGDGGMYFSSSERVANEYADPTRVSVYLRAVAVKDVRWAEETRNPPGFSAEDMDRLLEGAREEGQDGLIVRGIRDGWSTISQTADTFVVFEPTQIKSLDNSGAFDPNDPSILRQASAAKQHADTLAYSPQLWRAWREYKANNDGEIYVSPDGTLLATNDMAERGMAARAEDRVTDLARSAGVAAELVLEADPRLAGAAPLELFEPQADANGNVAVYHWSNTDGIDALDPAFWGETTAITRAERQDIASGAPRRTYFGIAPGRIGGYVVEFGDRQNIYKAEVPLARLYPAGPDSELRGEAAIKNAGYLGYWTKNRELGLVAVIFEPTPVTKVAAVESETFYQTGPAAFYSALERVVAGGPVRAPAAQWVSTIRNAPGVKEEEVDWTDVVEWLEGQDGPVECSAVVEYLQNHGVEVEEVLLSADYVAADIFSDDEEVEIEDDNGDPTGEYEYETRWYVSLRDGDTEMFWSREDAEEAVRDYQTSGNGGTQFAEYSSDKDNETYRELLFRLPVGQRGNPTDAPSTHWEARGVVAHVRFMDKRDADDNRVLHIEETQSDWHQKGRDQGYRTAMSDDERADAMDAATLATRVARQQIDEIEERISAAIEAGIERGKARDAEYTKEIVDGFSDDLASSIEYKRRNARQQMLTVFGGSARQGLEDELKLARLRLTEAEVAFNSAMSPKGIPDAPFKNTWPTLVMKRMVRWAAEHGYDKITWITGEQQNGGQTVGTAGEVYITTTEDGRFNIDGDGEVDRAVDKKIEQIRKNPPKNFEIGFGVHYSADEIKAVFNTYSAKLGDEMVAKAHPVILDEEGYYTRQGATSFDASEVGVVDDGHFFYDRMLVNETNKLIKKWGAKVEPVVLAENSSAARRAKEDEYNDLQITIASMIGPPPRGAYRWSTEILDAEIAKFDASKREETLARLDARIAENEDPQPDPSFDEETRARFFSMMDASQNSLRQQREAMVEASAAGGQFDQRVEELEAARAMIEELSALKEAPLDVSGAKTNPGFPITEKMREAALAGQPLFQARPQGARGQVEFTTDGRSVITLFETADPSTLIHELGHVFFEEMKRNAANPAAPQQLKDDWETLRAYLGDNGQPIVGDRITREGHELIARSFERFALEGRPPAPALARAFASFRKWLQAIYSTVDALRAPITPEVREVFARWFATEDEIANVEQDHAKALLDVKPDQMSVSEFEAYRNSVIAARNDAFNRLLEKTMRPIRAQRLNEFRQQRNEIRDIVSREVNDEPRFRALDSLRKDMKLDRDWLVERYGEDALDRLPKGAILVKKGGDDAELIAEEAGYRAAADMIDGLFAIAEETAAMRASGDKRSVRDKVIAQRVAEELDKSGAGDPLRDDAIEAEALGAIHGEKLGEVYSAELRVLGRANGRQPTPYKVAREWAARRIRGGNVNDSASKSAIQRFARAAAKSGREAEQAYAKGDMAEAFRHKQAQLINHALAAEAKVAYDKVDRAARRLSRIAKRANQRSIAPEYFDRVQQLLALFEFRPVSQKMLDEAEGFQKWAEEEEANGFEVYAPKRLLLNKGHYSRIPVGAMLDLDDAVASLMALGRRKQKLIDGRRERDFVAMIDEMVERIKLIPDRKLPTAINDDDRVLAGAMAALLKIETLAEELDGGKTGPFNRLLADRATDAENLRAQQRDMVLFPIADAYKAMSTAHRKRLEEKITIPEFIHYGSELDTRNGQPTTMTRMELLSIALNTGNESNFDKLSRGEKWSQTSIDAVLQRELTQDDWRFVGTVWSSLDLLWPSIAATEREMSGMVPERVVPRAIQTRWGPVKGGYYPVVYDPTRAQFAENNATAAANDLFGGRSGVGTSKGHTIARTDAAGPILRSVEGVLMHHVEKVITRNAFALYARDVLRVVQHPRVRGAIDVKLGREYRKQIAPWLQRTINSGAIDSRGLQWWDKLLRGMRVNLTIVAMGLRVSTGVAQISGFMSSAGRIGILPLTRGVASLAKPGGMTIKQIFALSPEMARRHEEVNRDVADFMKSVRGKDTLLNRARQMAFWHIAMTDRWVSAATWTGAYQTARDGGMTSVEAANLADKEVRLSQGSGRTNTLSNFQDPNSEAMRGLTLFYSYFNVYLQSQWLAVRDVKRGRFMKAAVATFWFSLMAPLMDALLSADPPPDDEDEEAWYTWVLRNFLAQQASGIPFGRDLGNYAERKWRGEFASGPQTPWGRIADQTIRAGTAIEKSGSAWWTDGADAAAEEAPDNWLKLAIETPGYFVGLPTGQPAATAQFLWDYQQGDVEPRGVTDWYTGLTKGRLPEDDEDQN